MEAMSSINVVKEDDRLLKIDFDFVSFIAVNSYFERV
jgi:hypothetical protein